MKVHSLRTKFMLLFFAFFFVPYGLLTLFSVSTSRGMMKKGTMEHLENLVEVKETAIEQWVKERISDGKETAASREILSLDPKRIGSFISFARSVERAYLEIWVLNLKGQLVSGRPSHISFEREEWFQKALEGGPFVALRDAGGPGALASAMAISFGLKDATGQPVGVLRELVDLNYISELISESKLGKTGEFFIVNSQGEFILLSRSMDASKRRPSKVPYFEKAEFRPTYTGVYQGYAGGKVLGSWKWIESLRCYLVAEQDIREAFYEIDTLVRSAIILFVVSGGLILGTSYWVIGRVTTPIKRLSETVVSFSHGHFDKTVSSRRGDEIGALIAGFNVMADRLEKAYSDLEGKVEASNKELEVAYQMLKQRQEQLVRSEKMAALGQLSAGIAHEIRNPLTSIKIFIQSLEKEVESDDDQKNDFRIIMKEIDRINENITRFLNFARPEEPLFQPISVSLLIRDTLNLLAPKLKDSGIALDLSLIDEHPPVEGDPKQLSQVFLNLLINAIESMTGGGTLTVRSRVELNPESRQEVLEVLVKDTGQGIAEKDRPYLFDPFYTTKAGGTGLGLSIVYSIIQKHNGRIEVESELGKGSTFILSLPIQKEKAWREFSS